MYYYILKTEKALVMIKRVDFLITLSSPWVSMFQQCTLITTCLSVLLLYFLKGSPKLLSILARIAVAHCYRKKNHNGCVSEKLFVKGHWIRAHVSKDAAL